MLAPGQIVSLSIEKPAVGGWMIARVDGQVVLVSGAIPGERVRARVTRTAKGVAWAATVHVDDPSADRREPFTDPACGGCLYAHVSYPRQLLLKAAVIADAFGRIARVELAGAPVVRASPDEGYRMRARLHVRGGRIGFFREGTHDLCDVAATRQLLRSAVDAVEKVGGAIASARIDGVTELELSENIDASHRAIAVSIVGGGESSLQTISRRLLDGVSSIDGLTGVLVAPGDRPTPHTVTGTPYVVDALKFDAVEVRLRRHALAFFQGNRFLLQPLVDHVTATIAPGSEVVDFYAGAGLFAVCASAVRGARVTAVEGDRFAAADLAANAGQTGGAVRAVHQPVERFSSAGSPRPAAAIVDPPRTGMSSEALARVIGTAAGRLVYVSCDVATLARDTRKIVDAGYRIAAIDAFDLFPNTPHVETVVVFDRR